ncbi:alpha-1,2-mannosidase, putative [Chitinophaga sp. YR573]|uniref:GH92 family glycosyl hydrolase n=1 Tax=Chitinophaga sp. YR573 TaxID=1881040 RepID=UPI0008C10DAE|nr:GH92 family glycosyl hydrolase [Chitinophaga sp. YR573]SEW25320.1 alpha-1,2-mannosidase, putative [Chitinophaga sp. YR573]
MYKLFILLFFAGTVANAQDLTHYVQPMAGTAAATTKSALKHGTGGELFANTIPAVTMPFGMTQWTPQTQMSEKKCLPPYYYRDTLFNGIRGSHWLSGSCTQDYGSVTIMPVTGTLKTTDYSVRFKHTDEKSTPYGYRINLREEQVEVAVTSTPRCGLMQFKMNKADSLYLLITPNSDYHEGFIKIDAEKGEIYGYNPVHRIYQGWGKQAGFSGYFVIRFEKGIDSKGTFAMSQIFSTDSIGNQPGIGAYVGFKMDKGEHFTIRIGTSFTGIEGARKNLSEEAETIDFVTAFANCKSVWQKTLSQIKVETDNERDKQIFYTSYYHAMQQPRLFNDVDGLYPMFSSDYQNSTLTKGNYYDDFSMWDIYRAQIPLFEILNPPLINNLVQSLILKGKQGGWMPIFPCWNSYTSEMIGDHPTSVISSAYLKGIRNYNVKEAYEILRHNAFNTPASKTDYVEGKGRRALESYLKYHYIPLEDSVKDAFHKQEQVSRTLEYAYDDYALAQFAKGMEKTTDYQLLITRAGYYANVFDKKTGMVRGRHADGSWITPYHPDERESYITEGTARQYTFYVPHDVSGLSSLMGGPRKLESSLDSLFIKKEYWHGNEPGHQIPFMYNYTAAPWKTQAQVRKILSEEYSNGPGGLGGNDDAGQMSAWYMFAAMGFYPVNPIAGEYLLSSPIFTHVTVSLPKDKTFEIICHKTSKTAKYIHRAKWNGVLQADNFITYSNIMRGGKLELYLQDTPDKKWGSNPINQPKGMTK